LLRVAPNEFPKDFSNEDGFRWRVQEASSVSKTSTHTFITWRFSGISRSQLTAYASATVLSARQLFNLSPSRGTERAGGFPNTPLLALRAPFWYRLRRDRPRDGSTPLQRNLIQCPHCEKRFVRFREQTPIVNRSDGVRFHLTLFAGPDPRPRFSAGFYKNQVICHFAYAHDQFGAKDHTVSCS
jgi:hypothetical protein